MGPPYGKLPILFLYHSHISRDSYGGPIIGGPWKSHPKNGLHTSESRSALALQFKPWRTVIHRLKAWPLKKKPTKCDQV